MLAMCVRKAADTGGTPTMQGSSLTTGTSSTAKSSRRHKPGLKATRGRGVVATSAKQPAETTTEKRHPGTTVEVDCTVKTRDDTDGHLIYQKGDLVDQRCEFN